MNSNSKKFESVFRLDDLQQKLSGYPPLKAYSFTKRDNTEDFNSLLTLLPAGYSNNLFDKIESVDLIYSGSTNSPFLLTLAVGRNDTYQGKETYDIDVFNIAPDTDNTSSYFRQQWHHFKDDNGNRTSYEINPLILSDEEKKKELTYSTFLTGSTCYYSFNEYQSEKPDFYNMHIKSFGDLNM